MAGTWSPDGSAVFYSTSRGSAYDIYRKTVGGAGQEERVHEAGLVSLPTSVSPDGRLLAFSEQSGGTNWDLWILPLDGADEPYPFLQEPFDEVVGVFSPDGRWMAYHSNESGRQEVYVRPFPGPGRTWQVSTQGGRWATWREDGNEIIYQAVDGTLTAVPVLTRGDGLAFGTPEPLFPLPTHEENFRFSPTPDGDRFLAIERLDAQTSQPLTVIVNWTARQTD